MSDAEARGPAILQPVNGSSSRRSRGGITASAAVSSSNVAVATAANSAGGAQGKQFKTKKILIIFLCNYIRTDTFCNLSDQKI